MISVRVLTIVGVAPSPHPGVGCEHSQHSKFVRRRQYVKQTLIPQLQAMGLETDIFPAVVDGDFVREGNTIFYKDMTFPVDYGQIGCFLSHVMLWKLCIEKNCTLLVLEDDALLPAEHQANVLEALKQYDELPDQGYTLYLQGQLPYAQYGIHLFPAHTLYVVTPGLRHAFPINDLAGTAAYAIKPLAAKRLLERMRTMPISAVDGSIHRAVNERVIRVLVPANFHHVFMLNDHWAAWNHDHDPNVVQGDLF